MKEKTFKKIWTTTQILLFILPIIILVCLTPYDIGEDKLWSQEVTIRNLEQESEALTDFKQAVVAEKDINGDFVKIKYRLQHQELYYFQAILFGVLLGVLLQVLNIVWWAMYDTSYW